LNNLASTGYPGLRELEVLEQSFGTWLTRKSELLLSLVEGKKVLEIGCGTGSITQYLVKKSLEVTGVDSSADCIEKAKRKGINANFIQADVCDLKSLIELYDCFNCVVMSDVLEHIEKTDTALRKAWHLLKRNGILILTVPAFQALYSEFDYRLGHLRRYSKKGLIEELNSAGFLVEECRFWNIVGLVGWLIVHKILNRLTLVELNVALIRLYDNLLRFEKRIELPVGLTLIAKARKPSLM